MGEMITGRIAVQDLNQKRMNGRYGINATITPTVPQFMAHGHNGFAAQNRRQIGLDSIKCLQNTECHPWPPVDLVS